jgi:hypothetical protein
MNILKLKMEIFLLTFCTNISLYISRKIPISTITQEYKQIILYKTKKNRLSIIFRICSFIICQDNSFISEQI